VTCSIDSGTQPAATTAARTATALGERLRLDWGRRAQGAVAAGHGLRIPVAADESGWQFSYWMVAHATTTGVTRVQFADQQWSADDGTWSTAENVTEQVVVEVRDAG
jgi:hypothetical protein